MGLFNLDPVAASVPMRQMNCGECGITHWVPEDFMAEKQRTGKGWHCPNGHQRVYRETDLSKALKALEEQKRKTASAEADAEWQRAQAKNARAQETRAKNELKRTVSRVNAGVCPHCNRTFKQLAAHMKCKHPHLPQ